MPSAVVVKPKPLASPRIARTNTKLSLSLTTRSTNLRSILILSNLPPCKRRIPGPEIVEGDSNSRLPQFVDHSLRHVDIFYKRALGTTLIPNVVYTIIWAGRLQRHRAIWEELQFRLQLTDHPNAISVLFRVLFELSIENYIERTNLSSVHPNDKLARKALQVAEDLHSKKKIDQKYLGVFQKLQQIDPLVSMDTLNRYVHSPNFAPSPEHLTALWDTLSQFIVHCLNA